MRQLPRAAEAVVDLRKLANYALDPSHPRGRHKARVFASALGVGRSDAGWLRKAVLQVLSRVDAFEEGRDGFGERWRVDIPVARADRGAVVRTHWLLPADGSPPRLITCYVL
jgi:hypothetical protein